VLVRLDRGARHPAGGDELVTALRWDLVRRAVGDLEELLEDPANLARADVVQAYARDTFDRFGLVLADPETLFAALTTAAFLVELANNAHEREGLSETELYVVARLAQSFALGVLPYLPPEART
jgi:hypothetical protein